MCRCHDKTTSNFHLDLFDGFKKELAKIFKLCKILLPISNVSQYFG